MNTLTGTIKSFLIYLLMSALGFGIVLTVLGGTILGILLFGDKF